MLGVWSSWLMPHPIPPGAEQRDNSGKPWWQITPDDRAGELLAWGDRTAAPTIWRKTRCCVRSIRCGTPIRCATWCRWTGRAIARALRTVWLRSLGRPGQADDLGCGAEREPLQRRDRGLERCRASAGWRATAATQPSAGLGARQALRRARMAGQPGLPHAEGNLSARLRLAAAAGRGGRHGRGGAAAAQLPPAPVRRCDEPDTAAGVQPGGAAAGDGDRRRQPCRWRAQPDGRPEGRAG